MLLNDQIARFVVPMTEFLTGNSHWKLVRAWMPTAEVFVRKTPTLNSTSHCAILRCLAMFKSFVLQGLFHMFRLIAIAANHFIFGGHENRNREADSRSMPRCSSWNMARTCCKRDILIAGGSVVLASSKPYVYFRGPNHRSYWQTWSEGSKSECQQGRLSTNQTMITHQIPKPSPLSSGLNIKT